MALILITGASRGLGRNAAAALADDGHDVVIHVRDRAFTDPAGATRWKGTVVGDLAELDGIRSVARHASEFGRFAAIVHSAGTMDSRDGVMVNTVAPYALTALLEKPDRLIYLSSSMHRSGSQDLRRLAAGTASYSDSKLWVTTLAMALTSRWKGTSSHAVDPGWVPTRMGGPGAPDDLRAGHETQVWLAAQHDVIPHSGGYWYHQRTQQAHRAAYDEEFQASLVAALSRRTGITLD